MDWLGQYVTRVGVYYLSDWQLSTKSGLPMQRMLSVFGYIFGLDGMGLSGTCSLFENNCR